MLGPVPFQGKERVRAQSHDSVQPGASPFLMNIRSEPTITTSPVRIVPLKKIGEKKLVQNVAAAQQDVPRAQFLQRGHG